jgi:dephospho-CoA kinase
MIKVGITGGIGSGKSLICEVFAQAGYPVYNADDRAKFLITNDEVLKSAVVKLLGEEAFVDGEYNRRFVAGKVFSNDSLLNGLNALVHPKVDEDFARFAKEDRSAIVFKESALLYETEGYKNLHATIYMSSPTALRIERIMKRDAFRTEEEIINIIDKQIPESKAVLLADYIVVNDEVESILEQVNEIEEILLLE